MFPNDLLFSFLAYLPTIRQKLYAKSSLLLPVELNGIEATTFSFIEITPTPQHNKAFLARIIGPPNESVYAHFWKKTHLNMILAEDSFLRSESEPRKKFLEAFDNGPPKAYATAKYGGNIGATMLFFEHDLARKPENCEKGWKGKFIGTFIKWTHEKSPQRSNHYDRDFPSRAYAHAHQNNPLPWTLGFHVHTTDHQREEQVQVLTDETEDILLDVIGNESIVKDATETCIHDIKSEKNRIRTALEEGKLRNVLLEKLRFFSNIEPKKDSLTYSEENT
jgi:hypothetical protein